MERAPALSLPRCTGLPWRSATLLWPYRGSVVPAVSFVFDGAQARIRHPELGEVAVVTSLP